MATLNFEIGPDAIQTGLPGDTTTARVYFGPEGAPVLLGTYTSNPESGNDGVRDWKAFAVTVTHNPALDYEVNVDYVSGSDTTHVRRVYLTRDDASVRNAEYPKGKAYTAAQLDALGLPTTEIGEDDGDFAFGASVYDACALTTHYFGPGQRCRWFFSASPVDPCPPSVGGWAIGGVRIG